MARKKFKRGGGRFVQLGHWMLDSPAWQSLSVGARALYVELKKLYNGTNNGDLYLSVRRAGELLGCGKNTADRWFAELEERGFIKKAVPGHLGSDGRGIATKWILTEAMYSGSSATKEFMKWTPQKNNPVPMVGTPCPHERDIRRGKNPATVPMVGTLPPHSTPDPVPMRGTYTHLAIGPDGEGEQTKATNSKRKERA